MEGLSDGSDKSIKKKRMLSFVRRKRCRAQGWHPFYFQKPILPSVCVSIFRRFLPQRDIDRLTDALSEKELLLAEKDNCIAEKDNCIAEKDAEIRRLSELLADSAR